MQIPTPTPTVVEQQRGPQVNCSCPAGDKVRPPKCTRFYPCLLFPWFSGNPFERFSRDVCVFYFSQGDIGAPGVAGPKGEKVIYHCSYVHICVCHKA